MVSKKIYFASDFHLGLDGLHSSRDREKMIIDWLDGIMVDVEALYLVGDIFDHWFEYKRAVPKGFTRLMGKLAQISDAGHQVWHPIEIVADALQS